MRPRLFIAIGAIAFSCLLASAVSAATIIPGYAVGGIGQTSEVGMTTYRDLDGDGTSEEVIKYYIPLSESQSGTYDVTQVGWSYWSGPKYAGMQSDSSTAANPSGWLDMYLRFAPVEEPGPHFMRFFFEDLDLDGVNDPANFLEDITIYDADNNVLGYFDTGGNYTSRDPLEPPYTAGDYSVESTNDYQKITLFNVEVPNDDFYVKLHFSADYERVYTTCRSWGWGHNSCYNYCNQYFDKIKNTPEYLRAEIEAWPPELVPVPAAMPLFLSGLAALGFVGGRRRKKKAQSPDA